MLLFRQTAVKTTLYVLIELKTMDREPLNNKSVET